MKKEILELRNKAEEGRYLYRINKISREEAKIMIEPYLDAVNNKQKELAKKYNQKVKKVTFISYIR